MNLFKSRKKILENKVDNLNTNQNENSYMICEKMNFAVAESFKLLRTNLMFSLPDETGCRIIGFTSALKNEGKSTISINTAYSLAETGKRVLLLEADMRLPQIAQRLELSLSPGLSNIFSGEADVIQNYNSKVEFDVITAGDIPPNPSELLGSAKMVSIIKQLSNVYDYILIDLPPVSAVSDALVVSNLLSGMVIVVRQDYNDRNSLAETMRQIEFTKVKILGFVFNSVRDTSHHYYNKKYKNEYYQKDYEIFTDGVKSD